jgi:hypothetical protein
MRDRPVGCGSPNRDAAYQTFDLFPRYSAKAEGLNYLTNHFEILLWRLIDEVSLVNQSQVNTLSLYVTRL